MRPWTQDDELRFALAFELRRVRPLLHRIVLETHPDEDTDPANAAAERIIEHVKLCGSRVSHEKDKR